VSESITDEEMEIISDSQLLRQIHRNRWYRHDNPDTYLILVNNCFDSVKQGQQLMIEYG
jgi:hypothetical protein